MLGLELKRFESSGVLHHAGGEFDVLSKKPSVVIMKVSDSLMHLTLRHAWQLSTRAVLSSNLSNLLTTTGPMPSNRVYWRPKIMQLCGGNIQVIFYHVTEYFVNKIGACVSMNKMSRMFGSSCLWVRSKAPLHPLL